MVQQGDEGLLPFPGKLSSNQKPACRLYALHTGWFSCGNRDRKTAASIR